MIFELDSNPFPVEEELINTFREPEHEEAIKALFSGNQKLFLQILDNNQKGYFSLSAHRALIEAFGLHDNNSKSQFNTLLTQKLADLLMQSQVESRFFLTPLQKSLHNYLRQQYFEEKHKTKVNETLLNAYKHIFRRIENIDDLLFFTDFVINVYVREPFDFVLNACKDILTNKQEIAGSLKILEKNQTFSSEEQLIVKYCFCSIVVNLSKKSQYPYTDAIIDEVKQTLRTTPYRRLAETIISLDPFLFVEHFLHNHKHPRQVIDYNFKSNEITLQCSNMHPDLRSYETFSAYFKKMKYLEQMVQKYEIISHSSQLEDEKVLLGINYDLLSYDTDIGYEYTLRISSKTITQYTQFMNQLVNHLSWQFVPIREQRERDKMYNLKYICKVFENFVYLNRLRSSRSQIHANQHALIVWGKLFVKWLQMEDLKNEQFITSAIQNYFSLFSLNEGQEEFPNLFNFQSQISKTIFELMVKIESFPPQEECFKGIKNIFLRWSQQMIPQTPQLKAIISKMMKCFFSEELNLKTYIKEDIFETPAIFKTVKKLINLSIIDYIQEKYHSIEIQKIKSNSNPQPKTHAKFFTKIGYIISSRIIGEASQKFAAVTMKFFLNYAHVWPILHSYRMWILQVCKDSINMNFDEKVLNLRDMVGIISKQFQMSKDGELSKQAKDVLDEFIYTVYLNINSFRMKRNKNNLSADNCQNYLKLMLELEELVVKVRKIKNTDKVSIEEYLKYGYNVQQELKFILQEFKMTFRFWLCNSNRFLNVKEEESIMNFIGHLMTDLIGKSSQEQTSGWTFICDIMGLNDFNIKTTINSKQIMGPLQKYTAKLNNKLQDFIPFNFSISLYSSIRNNYKQILKSIFTSLFKKQNQDQLWLITQKIMLSSVIICGPCIFNGQHQQKTKEDMAFGVFYDQFQKITELLTEKQYTESTQILIMLEKKKNIFSRFYDVLKAKNSKIVQRLKANPPEHHHRFRGRPMQVEDVMQALGDMGVSREQAEIALDNIEYPDHNLAMEWLDNNQDRIVEILTARTMERTRQDHGRREMKKEVSQGEVASLFFDSFQEKIIALSRMWIKVIFKELFKKENMGDGETLKNILFMFMDSLKSDKAKKQYKNLYQKICQDIDQLNKQQVISDQIGLLLMLLEGTFLKTEEAKTNFYAHSINLKILSYLPKIKTEQALGRVFSVINVSLPVFNNTDVITTELDNYLVYLLDAILQYKISHKSQSQIMVKIAKTGRQNLMQRITRNLTIFFKENLIKDSIFTLINMILESDKTLSYVNAQLDLKTFLYQRYKHRLASFHPDKEHVLEIDIKEYSTSFQKYERGSAIYEVSKQMLSKKKNKNKLLFYDCRKDKNQFDYSHFGNSKFINFPLKEHFKTMIKSILTTLFETTEKQTQNQIISDLHKLLYNYRILLPFTIHQEVSGTNLIDWLLTTHNHSKKKYKFITFLTLNSNLFIKREGYNFISLSDFVCAKIITHIMSSHQNILWNSFSALYLSQVKKFSEFSTANYSQQNKKTLVAFFQEIIEKVSPIEYLTVSEFLYVQYKRKLLDNLRRKYKFAASNMESAFDRQFLNISPFFNSVSMKKQQKTQKSVPEAVMVPQFEEEDEDEDGQEMIFQNLRGGIFQRRMVGGDRQPLPQQLMVPLPIAEPKEDQKQSQMKEENEKQKQPQNLQPIVLQTCQYLEVILFEFDKYLSFQQQSGSIFQIKQTKLPEGPILILHPETIGTKLNLENLYLDTELKVKKLAGFEQRISDIHSVISPQSQWESKKENHNNNINNNNPERISLSRRLLQSLAQPNRQTLMTLERLIHGRINRADDGSNNPPVRNININDIYQHMEEFTQPIVPIVQQPEPPKQEPMEIQQPKPQNQEDKKQNEEEPKPEVPPQEPIVHEAVNEPQQPQQEVVVIIQNPQPIEEEPYHPLPDEPIEEEQGHISPAIEIETIVDPANEPEVHVEQHPPANNQAPQPVPAPNAENNPPAQEPPARQREILTMLGLPQSFLRDVGLDEEFFDSLPEDLQQEQLMTFMAQQGANINRGGSRPNQPNQPQDLQSQNIAFLESLDPQTRAQVLIEATPEFLATLPPNIREEADRHRSFQINRMIEEEQIEQERNYINQKAKGPLVYPKVQKEQFSPMTQEAASAIFKGVFNLYPKVKLSALKILLENKTTQEKAIASIIALIYSFQEKHQQIRKRPISKLEIINKEIKVSENHNWSSDQMNQIRINLLHLVLQHMKISVYKDEEFLTQKIKTNVYLEELQPCLEGKEYLDPITELSSFALSYYPDLAPELLKKAKELPNELFTKIVEGIAKEKWPTELYDSLQNFSENQRLKQIFTNYFQEKAPKIQILGKLLKYKFSHLPTLKKIHQDALEYNNTSYYEFLNQIFTIYTVDSLNEIEPLLVKHKQIHFEVIKYLYLQGKELEKEPIGIILKKPQLLDFETKKFIFRNHPKLRKTSGRRVHIEVDRTHLFQGSYNQLMSRTVRELEGKIQVSFINEPGYDAGGLRREWFLLVSREIFNQDYALFQKSSSGSTYQPNPKSYVNPDHLNYFKFIGRFIGKSLVEKELIDAYFTRAFYKMILGQQLEFKDLQAQDYQFYKSMQWLKDNKIDENTFTFSYIYDNFGNKVEKQLMEGGKNIVVNEENKLEYIEKYCMSKMRDDFSTQINKFLEGFHEVVPQECISFFEAKELELLISGVPEVDIQDLKRNTDYSGYNPTDQIIIWFWEIISEYSQEDLAKLVQFITGTSKIPVEGFSHMIGMNGVQRISIHRDPCEHQLPKSHTCFNQLDLPNYPTKEILRQKLGICLAWGSEGFGFM